MERPDAEYDLESLREDDVICAQLRLNQDALRKHIKEVLPFAPRNLNPKP